MPCSFCIETKNKNYCINCVEYDENDSEIIINNKHLKNRLAVIEMKLNRQNSKVVLKNELIKQIDRK